MRTFLAPTLLGSGWAPCYWTRSESSPFLLLQAAKGWYSFRHLCLFAATPASASGSWEIGARIVKAVGGSILDAPFLVEVNIFRKIEEFGRGIGRQWKPFKALAWNCANNRGKDGGYDRHLNLGFCVHGSITSRWFQPVLYSSRNGQCIYPKI